MTDSVSIDILAETFNDLPIGVGIFHVQDLNDLKVYVTYL